MPGLLYKPDWEEAKKRYEAWWAHDSTGRCGMWVTAPRDNPPKVAEPICPTTPEQRWMDLDYIAALSEYRNSRTFFGGEAFPYWDWGFPGHQTLQAYLGCPIHFDYETAWDEPVLPGDSLDVSGLRLDDSNRYLRYTMQWLARGAAESPGKSIPAVGAFGGSGDTLAALRGTDRLLLDMAVRPDEVRKADLHLTDLWIEAYERFYRVVEQAACHGSTCWFHLWAPGRFYAVQNDFTYMISTEMFRDVFIPSIRKWAEFLDHSVYHVDGVEAFRHVPLLLEVEELEAFQILPGAGKPSPLHYLPVLKQVQAAGRNLHITIEPGEVETALRQLSARGLFVETRCKTEQDARELLRKAEHWSHDRVVV